MLNLNDIVKIISPVMVDDELKELFPVGTICKVVEIRSEKDGSLYYGVKPVTLFYTSTVTYYYTEKELEKGHLRWIKD